MHGACGFSLVVVVDFAKAIVAYCEGVPGLKSIPTVLLGGFVPLR